jgi:hypothetical protein
MVDVHFVRGRPVNAGEGSLLLSCSAGMDVQHVAAVVHTFGWSGAYEKYAGSERQELKSSWEITNYRQIGSYSMTSFARLFNYIIFITIFHGLRLKNIFLGALTGSSGTLFPVCILRIAHLFAAIL